MKNQLWRVLHLDGKENVYRLIFHSDDVIVVVNETAVCKTGCFKSIAEIEQLFSYYMSAQILEKIEI